MNRKRTIGRLVLRAKIDACVPPKVRILIQCRPLGVHAEFGYRYKRHLKATDKMWTAEGLPTKAATRHYAGFSGWMRDAADWRYLWRYIKACAHYRAVHKMDIVK